MNKKGNQAIPFLVAIGLGLLLLAFLIVVPTFLITFSRISGIILLSIGMLSIIWFKQNKLGLWLSIIGVALLLLSPFIAKIGMPSFTEQIKVAFLGWR